MAPPRKRLRDRKTPERPGREWKVRLPDDVAQRIETKARAEQRPANRVLINELAEYPTLKEGGGKLAETARHLETTLAKYSARIVAVDLADELLKAVDVVLSADGGARDSAIEKLRAVRFAMQDREQTAKRK